MDQMVTPLASRLVDDFRVVRRRTEALSAALTPEDQTIQSMEDASPVKWHRAHTTWFFEQFILRDRVKGFRSFDEDFNFLFNSYYVSLGPRHARTMRGMITRPGVAEVGAYRDAVDQAMEALIETAADDALATLVRLGISHEEQHQELLLTDIMHGLSQNPLAFEPGRARPIAAIPGWAEPPGPRAEGSKLVREGVIVPIGHDGAGFAFDNEGPRHGALLQPHALSTSLVSNADWLRFTEDGGYRRPGLWMSDGWARCQAEGRTAPLYWHVGDGVRMQFGLGGLAPLDPACPVRHISWYEADAYARWAGARLPTEFELEAAASLLPDFHGRVWQWSNSAYLPYPAYRPAAGAIGEYNGKFMINQMVLRGSSFATTPGHSRASYRNFFPPDKRWQVTGLRLAHDL